MADIGQGGPEQGIDGSPPAKKQKMLSKACEYCKLKKLRCDSARPCENCARKGTECMYKEKAQPGLRPGYGKDVERRLTALEEGYHRMDQMLRENLTLGQMGAVAAAAAAAVEPEVLDPELQQSYQAGQQPPTMGLPLLSSPPQGVHAAAAAGPVVTPGALPPAEILVELAELFFDMIYPWAPLFHKPTFMANMFASTREILLHGVLVVAFPFWRKPNSGPPPQTREAYVQASRDRIMLHCTDTCSVTSTQALALLAIDALGQGPGTRMWNVMAMLGASVQQLALAREPLAKSVDPATPMVANDEPESSAADATTVVAAEERRRLFWTIFNVDRFGSVSLGQAGGIPLGSIKLRHPTGDEEWSRGVVGPWFQPADPIKLGPGGGGRPWDSYIELLCLLDRSNRLLTRPFDFSLRAHREEWQCSFRILDATLNAWLETAPALCRDPWQASESEPFDPMWIMTRATFELIKLRLYTVAAFPSGTPTELPPSPSARVRCRDAVRTVTHLAIRLKPHEVDRLGPTFAFVIWVAARSLLILQTSGYEHTTHPGATSNDDLESLTGVLRAMSGRWPCAGRWVEILKLVWDSRDDPGGVESLRIFSDTRRTSYGLQALLLDQPAIREKAHELDMFDFFDMTFPHANEINSFMEPTMGQHVTQDWLE